MDEEIVSKKIENISKQFLCNFPLLNFNWHDIFDTFLTEHQQEFLLNKTVNAKLVLKYPILINYQKLFLKHIIENLENLQRQSVQEETVINDEIYSTYGRLVAAADSSKENFKHYAVDNECKNIITLKESNSLISDGTTGLRTWQASLALSEWIIQNQSLFNNKTILELGSGVGLTGLVLKTFSLAKSIYLTDCHEGVLEILCQNLNINLSNRNNNYEKLEYRTNFNWDTLGNRCKYLCDNNSPRIVVFDLPWENFDNNVCNELGSIETVIASDIVYDKELFKPLVNAVKNLKQFCAVQEFIFACTQRNANTLGEFLDLMGEIFPCVNQLTTPEPSIFLWANDTPVKIYQFKD